MAEAAKAQHSGLGTLILATHRLCHLDQVAHPPPNTLSSPTSLSPASQCPKLPSSDLYLSIAFLLVIKLADLFLFHEEETATLLCLFTVN